MNIRDLRNMLSLGEHKIFSDVSGMIGLGLAASDNLKAMISSDREEEIRTLNERIRLLEKQSDEISFTTSNEITNGAINSNIIQHLLELVEMADNILDDFYYLSREFNRVCGLGNDNEVYRSPQFRSEFMQLIDLSDRAMLLVQKLLQSREREQSSGIRREIEELEERGDNIKDGALDKLYAMSEHIHFLHFFHVSEVLHKLDDILDGCEDISDLYISVSISARMR